MPSQTNLVHSSVNQKSNNFCQTSSIGTDLRYYKNYQSQEVNFDDETIKQTLNKIAHLYGQLVEHYGFDPRSAGIEDHKLHKLRFDLLAQVIDLEIANKGISINDLGCGYGAMFGYLDRLKEVKLTKYYGYDISEQMLDAARNFVKESKAEFINSSQITQRADYSFVSGIFNVKFAASEKQWTKYIKQTLINVAEHSEKGFAFYMFKPKYQLGQQGFYNDDSTINPPLTQEDRYFADPVYFKNFCAIELPYLVSDWMGAIVKLEQDYGLFEWTITVHKN